MFGVSSTHALEIFAGVALLLAVVGAVRRRGKGTGMVSMGNNLYDKQK